MAEDARTLVDVAEAATSRALEAPVRTPDEMRAAVAALGDGLAAAAAAHHAVIAAGRELGAADRALSEELDGMFDELATIRVAGGAGDDDDALDAPAFAIRWDQDEPPRPSDDAELDALEARARGLFDAYVDRIAGWSVVAELERRTRAAMARLIARQRALRARYTAAQAEEPRLADLEVLRDELLGVMRALADETRLPTAVVTSGRRRAAAALIELAALLEAHGAVPGFGGRADRLRQQFALIRDGLAGFAAKPRAKKKRS